MALISLNLKAPPPEKRSSLENASIPLSTALSAMGFGTISDSNEVVTEQTALEVPTVLACVRILSEGVGSLPLRVYEELERGRKVAKWHPLYRLLTLQPNLESTAVTVMTTLALHAVLWQNAYCEIIRKPDGSVDELIPRMPWRTKPVRKNGRLVYETTDTAQGLTRVIDASDMIHIVGFSLDGLKGTQLVVLARQSVGLALVAAKYGGRFYANGARPGIMLQLDAPLEAEDMARLKSDLELLANGVNAHRVVILAPGMKPVEVKIDPVNAQYVETRKFEREEICALLRVPGYMAGAADKALKSTIEAQNLEFLTYSLRPWLERFEQEFNRKLLTVRSGNRYSIHFYTEALISVDQNTLNTSFTAGRTGGWLSINDIREIKGLPPVAGGDDYLQPLNMQKVGTAKEGVETSDETDEDEEPDGK